MSSIELGQLSTTFIDLYACTQHRIVITLVTVFFRIVVVLIYLS